MANEAPYLIAYKEPASTKKHNPWLNAAISAANTAIGFVGLGYVHSLIFSKNYTSNNAKWDALTGGLIGGTIGYVATALKNRDETIRDFLQRLDEKEAKTQAPQSQSRM